MKRLKLVLVLIGLIAVSALVIVSTSLFASGYLTATSTAATKPVVASCNVKGPNHVATLSGDAISPALTKAKLCDTLTITNIDPVGRLIAFGPHDNHQPYDGVTERLLTTGQSFTVTLNQVGSYHFHDHIEDIAQADFTVTK